MNGQFSLHFELLFTVTCFKWLTEDLLKNDSPSKVRMSKAARSRNAWTKVVKGKNFLYFLAHEQTKVSLAPEDRLDRFPAIDQSVGLISSATSVPLLIPLSRISCKKNIHKIRSHEHTNLACGIINLLLDVLFCSIAENFYSLFVFTGESKYDTTLKNTQRYYTTKRLIRYMYSTDKAFTATQTW